MFGDGVVCRNRGVVFGLQGRRVPAVTRTATSLTTVYARIIDRTRAPPPFSREWAVRVTSHERVSRRVPRRAAAARHLPPRRVVFAVKADKGRGDYARSSLTTNNGISFFSFFFVVPVRERKKENCRPLRVTVTS